MATKNVTGRNRRDKVQLQRPVTTKDEYNADVAGEPETFAEEFALVEAITGPMNAGVQSAQIIDPSLRSEIRFLHAPESPIRSWDEALGYFNFGEFDVSADGALTVRVVGVSGAALYEERFVR